MIRRGRLVRRTRLRPQPEDYSVEQRRRNTTLPTDPPPPDPQAFAFRQAVRERDCYGCTMAGYFNLPCSGPLDVHHVIPRSTAPERVYEVDNGTVVCRAHHDALDDHRYVHRAWALGVLGKAGDTVRNGRVVAR